MKAEFTKDGTAPKYDANDDTAGGDGLFRPANAGQRVDYAAYSLTENATMPAV